MNLKYLSISVIGVIYKFATRIRILAGMDAPILNHNPDGIVVSLTSYGRRARKIAPIVIYNFLFQKMPPSRIILWLGEEEFNDGNLPISLKRLRKYGVEIEYCKDLRSYNKLIGTLREYSNNIIITIDDDVIYSKDLVEKLYKQYLETPNCVITSRFHQPIIDTRGSLLPYNQWTENTIVNELPCIALGVGGVLYPPKTFTAEVFNEKTFKEICPLADDIWFWAMELSNGIFVKPLKKCVPLYPIDSFYQYIHSGSSLHKININENANDYQIKKVFDKYSIWGKLRGQS